MIAKMRSDDLQAEWQLLPSLEVTFANIFAPENRPSQEESSLPTINFQCVVLVLGRVSRRLCWEKCMQHRLDLVGQVWIFRQQKDYFNEYPDFFSKQ